MTDRNLPNAVRGVGRRAVLAGGLLPLAALAERPVSQSGALPDRAGFGHPGIYLDAAYVHPVGRAHSTAASVYLAARVSDPQAVSPRHNARNVAADSFARLINADPADIAIVPSTLEGENLVNASLGTGPGAGVVTDALHYDGSLALYGERQRQGMKLGVVRPRGGVIDLADVKAMLASRPRLLAVSLVSGTSGFTYDLAELCALAHAHGTLVYADIIQAAGAMPIDVRASGVDFACCGTYKWLMGDFGTAFLYVRSDRLDRLARVQVGWRQLANTQGHALPFDPPGPVLQDYALRAGAAGLFEVSTPDWGALAIVSATMDYIAQAGGVDAIARHRQPLLDRLHEALPAAGFQPLTPRTSPGPIASFAYRGAGARFAPRLAAAGIKISTYDNRIRISPSVYNAPDDIERLIGILDLGLSVVQSASSAERARACATLSVGAEAAFTPA